MNISVNRKSVGTKSIYVYMPAVFVEGAAGRQAGRAEYGRTRFPVKSFNLTTNIDLHVHNCPTCGHLDLGFEFVSPPAFFLSTLGLQNQD